MNSLVSESKVVCNESIPNPITTVSIPIPVVGTQDETKHITVLSGTIVKSKIHAEGYLKAEDATGKNSEEKAKATKQKINYEEESSERLSSPCVSEPMDCNFTPNISPSHVIKSGGASNEDIAMSEISVSGFQFLFHFYRYQLYSIFILFIINFWIIEKLLKSWSQKILK